MNTEGYVSMASREDDCWSRLGERAPKAWANQSLVPKFLPELRRNRVCKRGLICPLLFDGACAQADVGHRGVGGNELDRGRREWDLMPGAGRLQALHARECIR